MSIVELFGKDGLSKKEFKQLFEDKFEAIKLFIYYKCGDEAMASDVAQNTFMKVWENRKAIKKETVVSLLYKIANNQMISEFRRDKVMFQFEVKDTRTDMQLSGEDEYMYAETKQHYERTLAQMPEEIRVVFMMSRLEELKYREIAEHLQISIKTVEKRMSKALVLLKHELRSVV